MQMAEQKGVWSVRVSHPLDGMLTGLQLAKFTIILYPGFGMLAALLDSALLRVVARTLCAHACATSRHPYCQRGQALFERSWRTA